MADLAIPCNSKMKKKENEKLEKYQGLKKEVEKMWELKVTVLPLGIRALLKLCECLQQITGTKSKLSVQKSAVLRTAKLLHRTFKLPGLW